jgi:transcriptional regulator with XRE-family HTH domain
MPELARHRDEAMNRRRLELGMTWRQVATAAQISYETLRAVRKGETAGGELTLSSIERALRWAPGAFTHIDAGREPLPLLPDSEPTEPAERQATTGPDPRAEAFLTLLRDQPPHVQEAVARGLKNGQEPPKQFNGRHAL